MEEGAGLGGRRRSRPVMPSLRRTRLEECNSLGYWGVHSIPSQKQTLEHAHTLGPHPPLFVVKTPLFEQNCSPKLLLPVATAN